MPANSGRECAHCGRQTLHTQKHPVNHILHFLITIFTCGLWVVPWMSMTIGGMFDPWICTICGSETR